MKRKGFYFIAETLRATKPDQDEATEQEQWLWESFVETFGRRLEANYERFDKARFFSACGYGPDNTPR